MFKGSDQNSQSRVLEVGSWEFSSETRGTNGVEAENSWRGGGARVLPKVPAGLKSEIPTMALGPRVELINSYTGVPGGLGPGVEPLNSYTGFPVGLGPGVEPLNSYTRFLRSSWRWARAIKFLHQVSGRPLKFLGTFHCGGVHP